MSIYLYDLPVAPKETPSIYLETAKRFDLKIYSKIWNEEEEIEVNHHMYNYTQFSVRPYKLTYGCDGTTDNNIHYLGVLICKHFGIDYLEEYNIAYSERSEEEKEGFKKYIDYIFTDKVEYEWIKKTTIVPKKINELIVTQLMHDLAEINYPSFTEQLIKTFQTKNINANNYWKRVTKYHINSTPGN